MSVGLGTPASALPLVPGHSSLEQMQAVYLLSNVYIKLNPAATNSKHVRSPVALFNTKTSGVWMFRCMKVVQHGEECSHFVVWVSPRPPPGPFHRRLAVPF